MPGSQCVIDNPCGDRFGLAFAQVESKQGTGGEWLRSHRGSLDVVELSGRTCLQLGEFACGDWQRHDSLTDAVYRRAPYSARPGRDTRNAADAIYRNGGSRSLLKPKASGSGYVAALALGVHRT